jgi:hypothetical protein
MLMDCVSFGEEVMKTIPNTVPGDIRTLVMVAQQLKETHGSMDEEILTLIIPYATVQAREACIRVFGRHNEDVLKALVLRHSNCYFF